MSTPDPILDGDLLAAKRRLEALASGLERDLTVLALALWSGSDAELRRATLVLRGRALQTIDPVASARCWLAIAHALVVTDPEGAAPVAEHALRACTDALPTRAREAALLAALVGDRAGDDGADDPPTMACLAACARLAHARPSEQGGRLDEALTCTRRMPTERRRHARRWVARAAERAGLVLVRPGAGAAVIFDTLAGSVTVGAAAPVAFARSRRRFDLLFAIAQRPGASREALFEAVWGHRWLGASSKNALHAAVSRTRRAVSELSMRADEAGGYRLEGEPAVYLRGPDPSARATAREATALVGRESLLRDVRGALEPGAWVGLWGPPGSGKSRLAREVGHRWGGRLLRVDLRGATSRGAVVDAVARVLGCGPEEVRGALRARPDTLLILDDLDDAEGVPLAELVNGWRRGRASLRVLATQRHRGEIETPFLVPPLGADAGATLLVQHAGDVAIDRGAARELAQRVDGLPLALELAGRHLRRLSVGALLEVLPEVMSSEDGPVAVAVALSWRALAPEAQDALARLAIVDVPLPEEAARAVLGPNAGALEVLQARALVQDDGDTVHLLRAVRRHAVRFLSAEARREALDALVDWALALPMDAYGGSVPLLAAIHQLTCRHDVGHAVALCRVLVTRLQGFAAPTLPVALVEATLAVASEPYRDELKVLRAAALFDTARNDEARACLDEVEPRLPPGPLLGWVLLVRGKLARAARAPDVLARLDAAVGATEGDALREALTVRGFHRITSGDVPGGRRDMGRAMEVAQALGAAPRARAAANLGLASVLEGRLQEASRLIGGAVEGLEALGQLRIVRHTLHNLALVAHRLGRLEEAEATALRALEIHEQLGQPVRAASTRLGLASIALDRGDLELALRRAYRAMSDTEGVERMAWAHVEATGVAAAAHFELGQYAAASQVLAGAEDVLLTGLMRALLAARAGDVEGVEAAAVSAEATLKQVDPGSLRPSALYAVWGGLRHRLGQAGGAEQVARARELLDDEEVTVAYVVQVAEHLVLGRALDSRVPPSHLARALLR